MPASAALEHETDEDDETLDGRRLRAARNRDAVVAATLEIIREQQGGPIPGAAEVAERAGVSERTVFRHFADLDTLFLAAAGFQRPVLVHYLAPRPAMPELDKRVTAVVRLRSKLYEEIGPVRRVAVRLVNRNSVLAQAIDEANRGSRGQLAEVFAPELSRAGKAKVQLLDELDLVTSWSSWEHLRSQLHCTPERARKIMADLVSVLLTPYAGRRRR